MARSPTVGIVQVKFPRHIAEDSFDKLNMSNTERRLSTTTMKNREKTKDGITIASDEMETPLLGRINLSTLLRVDAALNKSLLLRHSAKMMLEKNSLVIDLSFFYQLLERTKVIFSSATPLSALSSKSNVDKPTSSSTETFEVQEQILLSLLRLGASHKLYRLRLRSLPLFGGKERVYFEVVCQNMNFARIEILKRQWRDLEHQGAITPLSHWNSSSIEDDKNMHLIKWHRRQMMSHKLPSKRQVDNHSSLLEPNTQADKKRTSPRNLINKTTNGSTKFLLSEDFIKPGMTLRERVKARAKHAETIQNIRKPEQMATELNSSNKNTNSNGALSQGLEKTDGKILFLQSAKISNASLRRLADALRSYIRKKESRFNAFSKASSEKPGSRGTIHISFKELMIHLNGAIYGTHGFTQKKRASKKEVYNCLVTLASTVPDWLTVVKHNPGADMGESVMRIQKNVDYQSCVTMALGGRVCKREHDVKELRSRRPFSTSSVSDKKEGNTSKSEGNHEKISKKRGKDETFQKEDECLKQSESKREPPVKKSKGSTQSLKKRNYSGNQMEESNQILKNRKFSTCLPQSQLKENDKHLKKSDMIRMNENLHFCDADREGKHGKVILKPSYRDGCDASPRGLKRLFSQLNSGQRI